MNAVSQASFETPVELDATASRPNALARLVAAWEAKTTRTARRLGGLTLLAVPLAACGGGSDDDEGGTSPVTYTLPDLLSAIADDSVADTYNVAIEDADLGTVTIADGNALGDAVDAAENADAFNDAVDAEEIAIDWVIADTLANVLAADPAESPIDGASLVEITEGGTLSVADLEGLQALEPSYAEGVSLAVSGTAAEVLASDADFTDAGGVAVEVTDASLDLSVADLASLQALGATYAEGVTPDVTDTVENADGKTIDGIANLTLTVAGLTPGADEQTVTLNATGTGAVTFDFGDADDTVVLADGSTFSGFTTLNVEDGTVDLTAADLGDITTINVASGVVLTAAQFLALEGGITGTGDVTIEVSTAAEAEAILAAAEANELDGFDSVTVTLGDGATITPGALESLQDDIDAAIAGSEGGSNADAQLLARLQTVQAREDDVTSAEAAKSAALQDALANENVADAVVIADEDAGATDEEIETALGVATTAVTGALGATATANDVTINFGADSAALIDSKLGTVRLALEETIDAAETALDAAADAFTSSLVPGRIDALIAAEDANDAAGDAYDEALDATTERLLALNGPSGGTAAVINGPDEAELRDDAPANGATLSKGGETVDILVLDDDGDLVLGEAVALVDGKYVITFPTEAASTVSVDLIDNLKAAIEAEIAAYDDWADADAAQTAAEDRVDEALEEGETQDAYRGAKDTLSGAEDALTDFDADVANWRALDAINTDIAEKDAAISDAEDEVAAAMLTITNAPDDEDVPGLGIAEVEFGNPATPGNDIFVFETGQDPATVAGFGAAGRDYIWLGEAYTIVRDVVDADTEFTENFGSATVLEAFIFEDGDDVVIWVEESAAAGNVTNGEDLAVITLSDVALADLTELGGALLASGDYAVPIA